MTMDGAEQNRRNTYPVYRSLSTKAFIIRRFYCTLSEGDLLVCASICLITMLIVDLTNSENLFWFDWFPVDPGSYFFLPVLCSFLLTAYNRWRPQDDLFEMIKGLFHRRRFSHAAAHPDNLWIPHNLNFYPGKAAIKHRNKLRGR